MNYNLVESHNKEFFRYKPAWATFHGPFGTRGLIYNLDRKFKIYTVNHLPIAYIIYNNIEDILYIDYIEVHPDYQYQGIGTFIINKLIDEMKESIKLVKLCSKYQAIAFYQKLGFQSEKKRTTATKRIMIKEL